MFRRVLRAGLGPAFAIGCIAAVPAAAHGVQSGGSGDFAWTVRPAVVGQTSTASRAAGGDPIYFASMLAKSGVVGLQMDFAGSISSCTGSLLGNRRSILTAGHCGSQAGARPDKVTAYFYDGGGNYNPDTNVFTSSLATAVDVTDVFVNPLYTGAIFDQNDVAVFNLASAAPSFATAYDLFGSGDLTGKVFTFDGYGLRSGDGGAEGYYLSDGRLREGENRFDFRFGDPALNGFYTDGRLGKGDVTYSWIADFDNGLAKNDASCGLGAFVGNTSSQFCDVGVGAREAIIAPGDSGGPAFVDGKIAAISSYSFVFARGGGNFGADYLPGLQSSWGEFAGFAPVEQSRSFILNAMSVPEPSSWAMLIVGFGAIGGAMRRQGRGRPNERLAAA